MPEQEFWDERWKTQQTGWDIGYPSPPIVEYFAKEKNKNLRILIPGCGNAYEAQYLLENGFTNITLVDISPTAVDILRKKFKNESGIKILCEDFFQLKGNFNILIEQTFFCAIKPELRASYAKKAAEILEPHGEIVGVMFGVEFEKPGPPFGGKTEEYHKIFKAYFEIIKMEPCLNSILPRSGNELFVRMMVKKNLKEISL